VTRHDALVRHPLAIFGALITTASGVGFVALALAIVAGLFENPYAGLVVFVLLPGIFVLGLLLIPAGIALQRRKLRRHPDAAVDWPVLDFGRTEVRRATLLITALTAVNVIIILIGGYGGLHWMESPSFCGQVCHTPMQPQFTALQDSSHARIACVNCHIGEGAAAFVHAKLSGVRQLAHVMTGSYPRPIPPGAEMPPGAQARTCGGCHQPGRVVGDEIRLFREYAEDEENTETRTVLRMHMGAASASGQAIHWHANPAVRIEYVATDARQKIPWISVTDAKGQVKEYVAEDARDQVISKSDRRMMDCLDCHNTVGHPIAPTPERAVDDAIASGLVSRQLPFVKREAVRLIKSSYPSQDEGANAIESGLRGFYASRGGSIDPEAVARTIAAVQNLYRRNVFPTMKVTFGSYPSNRGHTTSDGCFRCHDEAHIAKDGSKISGDCDYCHKEIETPRDPNS
jgi:NapC/NirT cytochrome c family, N-terminal region